MTEEFNTPNNSKGNPTPDARLRDRETARPKYTPANTDFRFTGCVNKSSMNSLVL